MASVRLRRTRRSGRAELAGRLEAAAARIAMPPLPPPAVRRPATRGSTACSTACRWSGGPVTYSDPDRAAPTTTGYGRPRRRRRQRLPGTTQADRPARRPCTRALTADAFGQPPGHAGFSVEGFTDLDDRLRRRGVRRRRRSALANTRDAAARRHRLRLLPARDRRPAATSGSTASGAHAGRRQLRLPTPSSTSSATRSG